jgi:hypothetical protein
MIRSVLGISRSAHDKSTSIPTGSIRYIDQKSAMTGPHFISGARISAAVKAMEKFGAKFYFQRAYSCGY